MNNLYTKKPITIEAHQWHKNGDHPDDYRQDLEFYGEGGGRVPVSEQKERNYEGQRVRYYRHPDVSGDTICKHCGNRMHVHGWIDTLEGGHIVCPGDWIIKGVKGEFYPCKPDIFEATYEPAVPQVAAAPDFEAWYRMHTKNRDYRRPGDEWLPLAGDKEDYREAFQDGAAWEASKRCAAAPEVAAPQRPAGFIKPDTATHVYFYEQDCYVLSNFSAFNLRRHGYDFPTSEHAYHAEKFRNYRGDIAKLIARAPSAHEAFQIAHRHKSDRIPCWDEVKVDVMRSILLAKAEQHEYVRRKLLATGDRILVEDSWRDDYWGWGPNQDGQNMLGKLWMEVRATLAERAAQAACDTGEAA